MLVRNSGGAGLPATTGSTSTASRTAFTSAPLPGARGGNQGESTEAADPEVMFVATNTAFRAATRQTTDRPRTVERLDTVIQAYGEVLRSDPANVDAAYNYEYAVRTRDIIARGRNTTKGRKPVDDELGRELSERLARLGYEGELPDALFRWAGNENLEERVEGAEAIDPVVLEELRRQS